MTAFEGFETTYTNCPSGARVFSYTKKNDASDSSLPVLVLLHGYPQNSLMFKHFVNEVPSKWRVLVPDLPGYVNLFFVSMTRIYVCVYMGLPSLTHILSTVYMP